MKGKLILILLGIIVVALAVTNPSEDIHKQVIKEKLHESMQSTIDEKTANGKDIYKALGKTLGSLVGNKVVDNTVDQIVYRDNYFVCSLTKCKWEGEDYTIGIGLLNKVFVTSKLETVFQDYLK